MKKILIMITACMLLFLSACGNSTDNGFVKVSSDKALTMMEEETGYIILDVRTEEEYTEQHIKGAINIPLDVIEEGKLDGLPDKEARIFVYCRTGIRSNDASEILAGNGYVNVVDIGGINTWEGDVE